MAETSMVLRVDQQLKADFEWACNHADTTASQALRRYMRKFVDEEMNKKAAVLVIEPSPAGGAQFVYNQNDAEEVLMIKRKLLLFQEFEKLHPTVPLMDYPEREKLKEKAWSVLHDQTLPTSDRANAAVDILKAHFMGSARGRINPEHPSSIKLHPGFDEYAKHYLRGVSLAKSFPDEVYEELLHRYPLKGPSLMNDSTSWPVDRLPKE